MLLLVSCAMESRTQVPSSLRVILILSATLLLFAHGDLEFGYEQLNVDTLNTIAILWGRVIHALLCLPNRVIGVDEQLLGDT